MTTRVYSAGGPKRPPTPAFRSRSVAPRSAISQQQMIARILAERRRNRVAGTVQPIVNAGALLGTLAIAHNMSLAKNLVAALVIAEGILRTVMS